MRFSTTTVAAGLLLALLAGCTGPASTGSPSSPTDFTPPTEDEFLAQWSDFEPFRVQGTGNARFDLPPEIADGMVRASHSGGGLFRLDWGDGMGTTSSLLIVQGRYDGVSILNYSGAEVDGASVEVTADGGWTFQIEPLANAPEFDLPVRGDFSAVYYTDGESAALADGILVESFELAVATHFSLRQVYGLGLDELFFNGSAGDVADVVQLHPGPSFIVVGSGAPWRIEPAE